MAEVVKKLAGKTLFLRYDLWPTPVSQKYVRAFFQDKNGNSVAPGSVDLLPVNFNTYVDTTQTMPSIDLLNVIYLVYDDAAYTEESYEFPGCREAYELDNLLPTQLPGEPSLEAEIFSSSYVADIEGGELQADLQGSEVTADLEANENLSAEIDVEQVDAENESAEELEANIDC